MNVAESFLLGSVLDEAQHSREVPSILMRTIGVVGVACLAFIASAAQRYYSSSIAIQVKQRVVEKSLSHALSLPPSTVHHLPAGQVATAVHQDAIEASESASSLITNLIGNGLGLAAMCTALGYVSLPIMGATLALMPLWLLPGSVLAGHLGRLTATRLNKLQDFTGMANELTSSSGVLHTSQFSHPSVETDGALSVYAKACIAEQRSDVLRTSFTSALGLLSALLIATIYGFGGVFVARGTSSIGEVVTASALAAQISSPLLGLTSIRLDFASFRVSNDRLSVLTGHSKDERWAIAEAPSLPGKKADIELRGVYYWHKGEDGRRFAAPALRDVTIRIPKGSFVAIVGASGSGKSTLAKIISGVYVADDGQAMLAGIDMSECPYFVRQRLVTLMDQEPYLLSSSIRDNFNFGHLAASDGDIIEILQKLDLGHLLDRPGDPLGVPLGDRGVKLSGGERQRLAIGRCASAKPSVIVLDEPTAHLDYVSEERFASYMHHLFAASTRIVIAHRLHTIRLADVIVVLKDGAVKEVGRHEDVLRQRGEYWRISQAT